MAQNAILAGMPRQSSKCGVHLRKVWTEETGKVMDVIMDIESAYPGKNIGPTLLKEFFPGKTTRRAEIEWWREGGDKSLYDHDRIAQKNRGVPFSRRPEGEKDNPFVLAPVEDALVQEERRSALDHRLCGPGPESPAPDRTAPATTGVETVRAEPAKVGVEPASVEALGLETPSPEPSSLENPNSDGRDAKKPISEELAVEKTTAAEEPSVDASARKVPVADLTVQEKFITEDARKKPARMEIAADEASTRDRSTGAGLSRNQCSTVI